MKRGQAAVEFLMTYGWAILAAVIAIGVLAYFGVFSPKSYDTHNNQCLIKIAEDVCKEYDLKLEFGSIYNIQGLGENPKATFDCKGEFNRLKGLEPVTTLYFTPDEMELCKNE